MFLQSLMKFHQSFFKILRKQNVTDTLSFVRTDGCENSIPSHKHSLRGGGGGGGGGGAEGFFAKFDEIPSKLIQDIKETKRYGHTFVRSFVRTDGCENSIPSHKHSLRGGGGYNNKGHFNNEDITIVILDRLDKAPTS